MEPLLLLLGALLAGFAGYTAQNASICSVRAVAEVFEDRDYRLLASFAKAVICATAIAAPLGWTIFGEIDTEMPRLTLFVLAGGFLACFLGYRMFKVVLASIRSGVYGDCFKPSNTRTRPP